MLINADLFACGIATLIQTIGVGPFGIRLPIIMGVTAVAISPMLAMAAMPGVGLTGIYGAVLVGGIFGLCVAPFVKYVLRFFPAVVTGTIITMIGVVLMRVGVDWAGGGAGGGGFRRRGLSADRRTRACRHSAASSNSPRGFVQNMAVLIGITVGYLVTIALGWTDFSGIQNEPLAARRFAAAIRHAGVLPRPVPDHVPGHDHRLHRGNRHVSRARRDDRPESRPRRRQARSASRLARHRSSARIFNTFPYVSYSQNIGLVGVTGVYSRWVCVDRRRHHAGARPDSETGLHRRVGAAMRARRRRLHHVRNGRGDRDQNSVDRGLCRTAQQRSGRRDLDRLRPDPDRLAEFLSHLPGRC